MVLLRSIFWLTAAYLIIGPSVNIPDSMNRISSQTLQGAKQIVAGQLDNINCTSLQCSGAKAVIATSLSAKAKEGNNAKTVPTTTYRQTDSTIPVPRPRLLRRG